MCSPTGGGSAPSTFSSSAGPAVVQEGPPFFFWSPEDEEGPGVTLAMGGACKSGSHNLCCSFELKERDNAVTEALGKVASNAKCSTRTVSETRTRSGQKVWRSEVRRRWKMMSTCCDS